MPDSKEYGYLSEQAEIRRNLQMAEEIAEYEYNHLSPTELLNLAKESLRRQWLDQAYRDPEGIQRAHKDMLGESGT